MKLYFLIFLFIFNLMFNGCSLYPPISESLIFNNGLKPNDSQIGSNLYSFHRISLASLFTNPNLQHYYLEKNNDKEVFTKSLNKLWQINFSTYGVLFKLSDNFYIGLNPNLLFNAGIDFTYEVVDDYFATAEATLFKNYKCILQKRIINNVDFINTLGIVYRHERLGFIENSLSQNAIEFYINSVGVRSLNGFNVFNNEMVLEISVLYELEYRTSIINLGFSYNLYNIF